MNQVFLSIKNQAFFKHYKQSVFQALQIKRFSFATSKRQALVYLPDMILNDSNPKTAKKINNGFTDSDTFD